jgi:hypothetical protein
MVPEGGVRFINAGRGFNMWCISGMIGSPQIERVRIFRSEPLSLWVEDFWVFLASLNAPALGGVRAKAHSSPHLCQISDSKATTGRLVNLGGQFSLGAKFCQELIRL